MKRRETTHLLLDEDLAPTGPMDIGTEVNGSGELLPINQASAKLGARAREIAWQRHLRLNEDDGTYQYNPLDMNKPFYIDTEESFASTLEHLSQRQDRLKDTNPEVRTAEYISYLTELMSRYETATETRQAIIKKQVIALIYSILYFDTAAKNNKELGAFIETASHTFDLELAA